MVELLEVTASNERVASTFPDGLVAVFVGGTSGVGEYTVKAFAKYTKKARAYIVGRSQEAADRIIEECQQLSPDGHFEFIKADVSLLKTVDEVCQQIKTKESAINILFETQGTISFGKTTAEGLPLASSLVAHSRLRFILNLLPLLQKASGLRRVVSVLAATCEGPIDTNNMAGLGFPLLKWRDQVSSIETLLLEEACRRAPDVSFIHALPGVVKSGITRDAEGFGMAARIAISNMLTYFLRTPPIECGERHMFLATSAVYAPSQGGGAIAGVEPREKQMVARGSDGQTGSGMYTVDNKGESSPSKVEQLLAEFRENGTAQRVWDYVEKDFQRITGALTGP